MFPCFRLAPCIWAPSPLPPQANHCLCEISLKSFLAPLYLSKSLSKAASRTSETGAALKVSMFLWCSDTGRFSVLKRSNANPSASRGRLSGRKVRNVPKIEAEVDGRRTRLAGRRRMHRLVDRLVGQRTGRLAWVSEPAQVIHRLKSDALQALVGTARDPT